MKTHQPYQEIFGHREDFKVKYRFFTKEEGGREVLPFQGLRSDFWYEDENHDENGAFMIWPEFENKEGELILHGTIEKEGIARMWIVNKEKRSYHQRRIKAGTKGYFFEGGKTADCEVIEIIDLMTNPTK